MLEAKHITQAVPVRVAIGIMAFNEAKNIGTLLGDLLGSAPEAVAKIFVVSSGSTDGTNEIVRKFTQLSQKVNLIEEAERMGKAHAFNKLFEVSQAYDIVICMGADNRVEEDSLRRLLLGFADSALGIATGRGRPLNGIRRFSDWSAHLVWNMHHLISLTRPKISGELFAFRSGVIREVPPGLVSDDAYIQNLFEIRGYKAGYDPKAEVSLMGPRKIKEFFNQRRRIFIGHRQVHFLLGRPISTFSLRNLAFLRKAMPSRGFRGYLYAVGFVVVTGAAWLASVWDFIRQTLPYRWETVATTKAFPHAIQTSKAGQEKETEPHI